MDIQYSFRLPSEVMEDLKVLAARLDISVAQLLRKIAREYVESQKEAQK